MNTPVSDIDLYSDDTLENTRAVYSELRDLGAVVYLKSNDLYAITRFDAVRTALRADKVLINGEGVAANEVINGAPKDTTITSDGETHNHRRTILRRPLLPKSLESLHERVGDSADALVRDLLGRDSFCGVADFASHLPVSIVADLVGLSDQGKDNMLEWAAATFNALGPLNPRCEEALPVALQAVDYVLGLTPDAVREAGWAHRVLMGREEGELSPAEASMMVLDYVAPSLDTTILATAHMLWRLGSTSGAFAALKADSALVESVVTESVRLASPIRCFTRLAQSDFGIEGSVLPAGSRAAVLYASANWDERHFPNAEEFRVDRNPRDQLGWGHGVHTCAGMHLARLEMESLLRSMIRHVDVIEVGEPEPLMNNILQGFAALPASLH
ncbi:MAG: cytochrome P450 [Pseudomonadota bacterium]